MSPRKLKSPNVVLPVLACRVISVSTSVSVPQASSLMFAAGGASLPDVHTSYAMPVHQHSILLGERKVQKMM